VPRLTLDIATNWYDRLAPLRDGRVQVEGVDFNWMSMKVEEIFWRQLRHREFDVSELSMAGYTMRRARGQDDMIAIPVFLSRSFRHNILYVHAGSGIETAEDLRGMRVGVPEYQITAAVWVRGILQDDHGITASDIEWHQGGLEKWGRKPFEPASPPGVTIVETPRGETLSGMLADGRIDALISPRIPSVVAAGDPRVRRLWADPAAASRDYFARTRVFPIMHTVAIKVELIEKHPWLPSTLLKAFTEAKQATAELLSDVGASHAMLPFLHQHLDETRDLMGADYWPYGLEANRRALDTFLRHMHEQGLTATRLDPEQLFAESTWHAQPI
jgi:4,5-dihydroxyphthalate decarboxylase